MSLTSAPLLRSVRDEKRTFVDRHMSNRSDVLFTYGSFPFSLRRVRSKFRPRSEPKSHVLPINRRRENLFSHKHLLSALLLFPAEFDGRRLRILALTLWTSTRFADATPTTATRSFRREETARKSTINAT